MSLFCLFFAAFAVVALAFNFCFQFPSVRERELLLLYALTLPPHNVSFFFLLFVSFFTVVALLAF
jgi:hypothetical protein